MIGPGLPTIPKPLLDKIWRWEYIDIAELPPASSGAQDATLLDSPPPRFTLFPGCEFIRPKRRQILTISDWVQGFTIYIAALSKRHPSATLELLAYQLTIIKASQQYDGLFWRAYDTHYRVNAAATGNKTWSRLDTDLYTRFFTGRAKQVTLCSICDSTGHTAPDCPRRTRKRDPKSLTIPATPKRRRQWPADVCAEFNTRGRACSRTGASTATSAGTAAATTQPETAAPRQTNPAPLGKPTKLVPSDGQPERRTCSHIASPPPPCRIIL